MLVDSITVNLRVTVTWFNCYEYTLSKEICPCHRGKLYAVENSSKSMQIVFAARYTLKLP